MPRSVTPRPRTGLTLVELLVSLTILSVVASLIATTMLGQQRLFQRTYEMVGVRRELRTAMSLMPADLRGVSSSGGDISSFTASSMTFRATMGASMVCARAGANTLYLPPTDLAHNTLSSWSTQPAVGDTAYVFDEGAETGAEDDTWRALTIASFSPELNQCAGAPFTDPALDAGKQRWLLTTVEPIPVTVLVGAGVRFTRRMEYRLDESEKTGRYYLTQQYMRNGAWDDPLIVSGPYDVPANGGIHLLYYDSLGVAVAPGGLSTRLARVDVTMRAVGLPGSQLVYEGADARPQDSIALRIALRNRQ